MKPFRFATWRYFCGLVIFLSLFLVNFQPVRAADVLFEDHFSGTNIDNWKVQRNQQKLNPEKPCLWYGDATDWGLKNNQLGIEIQSHPCLTDITPRNFFFPSDISYELEFKMNMPESVEMDRGVNFAWKDIYNYYNLKIFANALSVQKVIAGQNYMLLNRNGQFPFQANQSYNFKIRHQINHKVTVFVNDQQVIQATDDQPYIRGNQTIALTAGVGSVPKSLVYFDDVVVKTYDDNPAVKTLNVPLLKQTDPIWKDETYDHATSWSDRSTIQRWGCAMTSVAMIMRYYGMSVLPSGESLTPSTLNKWLISQADGYIGSGGVNWLAVTRLTRLIHEKLGTPKLEYTRVAQGSGTNLGIARSEILADKPVILEIVGHFLVGSGIEANNTDITIKDPAYRYTRFAQHNSALLSVRKFQPSFTDLSYLLFVHSPNLQLELRNQQNAVVPLDVFSEQMSEDQSDSNGNPTPNSAGLAKSPEIIQHTLAKPINGKYILKIWQTKPGPYQLQLFSYDQAANPTIFQRSGYIDQNGQEFSLELDKNSPAKIAPSASWSDLRTSLQTTKQQGLFSAGPLFSQLDSLVSYAQQIGKINSPDSLKTQLRYLNQIRQLITQSVSALQLAAKNFLLQQLVDLEKMLRL